ncbi:MAG: helix-turn-helix domain-containing protein [Planctomycetota bacterium]|jgi:DNA invertase Pin-like site-specific DNA recombinase
MRITFENYLHPCFDHRAERVKAGQAVAKAKGKRWGGSKPGWYAKVTPEQKKAILKMVDDGEKITKIARITGLSQPTIYRVLRNQERAA